MHILCPLEQLLHVEFDMAGLQLDSVVVQQTGKIVIHVGKYNDDSQWILCVAWQVVSSISVRKEVSILRTTNMSTISMIQGWFSALRILISRRAVTGMPSVLLRINIRLSATTLPVDL